MKLMSWPRSQLVRIKDGVDSHLHPARGKRARERLEAVAPASVLMICLGNVCRSPYAEWTLRERVGDRLSVESAGFIGPDRRPPDPALRVARSMGVDHRQHRSRVVTAEMLQRAEAVFFFDRFNRSRLLSAAGVRPERIFWLGDFDPEWEGKRSIVDPWGKPESEFRRVFRQIDRCVAEVSRVLGV
jgi:protein-tyrosine phosphatase